MTNLVDRPHRSFERRLDHRARPDHRPRRLLGLLTQWGLPIGATGSQIRAGDGLRDLLDRISYDCLWCAKAHGRRAVSACGVYLPDLEQPRPPDMPPGLVRSVVASND